MVKKLTRKLVTQYNKYLRVWRLLKRPSVTEFKTISKVTAIGLLIIGALGFVISKVGRLVVEKVRISDSVLLFTSVISMVHE